MGKKRNDSDSYKKLKKAIPDLKRAIKYKEVGIYPFYKESKKPKDIYEDKTHGKFWHEQPKLKHISSSRNFGIIIGFDPENKGHHSAVIDIDGFKKRPEEKNNNDYWYDEELHKKSCKLLFDILKEINMDFIAEKTWSGGYHLIYRSSEKVSTSDVKILKYLKYPQDWEIEELRGKAINGKFGDGIEVLAKSGFKKVVTFPSKVKETKINPETGGEETREGSYKLLNDVNYVRKLEPVDNLSDKLNDVLIEQGFIFDEKGYNNRHKNKEKLKKFINTPNPVANKELEITDELINNINPFYEKGSRNQFCFKLTGFLRKQGWNKEKIEDIFSYFHDDSFTEYKSWIAGVFNKDIEEVAGWKALSEHIINSSVTEEEQTKALGYLSSLRVKKIKTLSQDLLSKGWFLKGSELLIPYTYRPDWWNESTNEFKNNEYYYSVEKTEGKYPYLVSWKVKEPDSDIYPICEVYKSKKFIDIADEKRNRILGYNSLNSVFPKDKGEIKKFWSELPYLLGKYSIESLMSENFKILQTQKEKEAYDEQYPYKTFEDYPEHIQEEAIKIIEKNTFFTELLDSIGWKHEGDKETAMVLLLGCASVYIGEPVHQILNAERGEGKSDTFNRVKELQPEQYNVDLVSFTVKSLYYGNKQLLNDEFNILWIDDVKLVEDMVELLKLILDNERKYKSHKTVINQKFEEMELEGYYLGLINRAKDDIDMELIDRCYLNSLSENNKRKIKNKIKEKIVRNDMQYYENNTFILKACYQYLIDKEIKVYNPLLLFLDVDEYSNRNISHYLEFMKAMSFYNYHKRQKIDDTTIGSFEDIAIVLNIISKEFTIQKDKLTDLEKSIINELEKNPENNTNQKLATALERTSERIGQIIRGRDNQLGLKDKGYISVETVDKGHFNQNEYTLLKSYKEDPNNEIIYQTLKNFTCLMSENHLLTKKAIIVNFLEYKLVLINKYIEKKLTTFLENTKIEIDSYSSLCELIDSFYNDIKEDNDVIYIDSSKKITKKDLKYHNKFITNINNEVFLLLSEKPCSDFVVSKTMENSLKDEEELKYLQIHEIRKCLWVGTRKLASKNELNIMSINNVKNEGVKLTS